jgi:hypothetical protein
MGGRGAAEGKIEQWARWALWPALILTIARLAMLLAGVPERTWQWFLPVYLLIGVPLVLESFVSDFARLRSLWRSRKGTPDDPL